MSEVLRTLEVVSKAFEELRVHYAVMGGIAVRAHGLPRPTYDVDFVISVQQDQLEQIFERLDELGFRIPEIYRQGWVDRVAEMPLVKVETYIDGRAVAVDIFLAETSFLQSVMSRTQHAIVEGLELTLVSVEDLILLKVLANRLRDRADIADVRLVQGTLDEAYLQQWAKELDIEQRFADVWRETQP